MSAQKNKTQEPEGLSLEALESRSERLGEWISNNPTPILGTAGAILVVALAPLHREFGLTRVVVATYQAASGAGANSKDRLKRSLSILLGRVTGERKRGFLKSGESLILPIKAAAEGE